MNSRERFLEVALFGRPDKIPLALGDVRPATMRKWITQGLPENISVPEHLSFEACGLRSVNVTSCPNEGFKWEPSLSAINLGPMPPFEYKVLEDDERYRIWVDSLGVTQMGFQDDWRDGWSGFATRVFMDFPVKNRNDFEEVKKRYDPRDPQRYPKNWNRTAKAYKARDYPLCVTMRGPFWWTRDMMGLRGISLGIYRDPELISDIIDLCSQFHIQVLHRAFDDLDFDYVILNEDMAYKKGPMIGPDAVKKFMRRAYEELTTFFRNHGTKVIFVDSDGNAEPLIPVWLKSGINGTTPCEVAAGMDVVELGRKYPTLVMMGGIDKRELAKDEKSIEAELMRRVPPLIKRKGYFPGVDHAIPPDISLSNFRHFSSFLMRLCGWAD